MRANSVIVVDDPVIGRLLGLLERAAMLAHSRRTFLEHLLATWRILADWRMPAAVCRAGFMHSAYSTAFYPHALFALDERDTVRSMVGREAEALVFRFCTMDRRGYWDRLPRMGGQGWLTYPDRNREGAAVRVARKTLGQLLVIESANVAEQSSSSDGGPMPWMSRVLHWWRFFDENSLPVPLGAPRPRLTKEADESAIAAYQLALHLPARRALALLEHAMAQNPWAAEPRILWALCAQEEKRPTGDFDGASGVDLLCAWAVAWDKRLSWRGWQALAKRTLRGSHRQPATRVTFSLVCKILAGRAPKPRWMDV